MHRIEITGITFAAAHRIEGHPKCSRLHGHNYELSVTLERPAFDLDQQGMVADFGDIKRALKEYVDGKLDHRYLVSQDNMDAGCVYYLAAMGNFAAMDDICALPGLKFSTAEALAEYLFNTFTVRFEIMRLRVISVTVKEASNSSATYTER